MPAGIEVGAITTMAIPATIIVKLSAITSKKDFGLMGNNLQHTDTRRGILRRNVPPRVVVLRAVVASGATRSRLHGPL